MSRGYQARPKIHVIRVVFQDQALYVRTLLWGAKTCKIGKKGVFLVIQTNFGKKMTGKLRKMHAKTRIQGLFSYLKNTWLRCFLWGHWQAWHPLLPFKSPPGGHTIWFSGGHGSWGRVISFLFFRCQWQRSFVFCFYSSDGWFFFIQKPPFHHRILGSGWFPPPLPLAAKFLFFLIFFFLLRLVKFFFFFFLTSTAGEVFFSKKLPCPLPPGYKMVHPLKGRRRVLYAGQTIKLNVCSFFKCACQLGLGIFPPVRGSPPLASPQSDGENGQNQPFWANFWIFAPCIPPQNKLWCRHCSCRPKWVMRTNFQSTLRD